MALFICFRNTKYDVFLSYSWKQKSQATNLFNYLNKHFNCWMDQNEENGGEKLYQELVDVLADSKLIIFCISKPYCDSDNCNREFNYTMKHKKPFIPILFCEDKHKEFGLWPVINNIFLMLSNANNNTDVYKYLNDTVDSNNKTLNDLVESIKQKI